ncbi:MAG: hypothetical protein EOP59_03610 [Sphingomonadales bacterium]|nr:MAG: hypothetical protein EOP59_03610 [Sphingomonadales bacterium]
MTDSLRRLCRRIGLAITFVLAASAAPVVAKPCVSNCLKPGDYKVVTLHNLTPRTYWVHVPASYTGERDVPLLIDYHGGTKYGWNERGASGQLAESDRRGFIAVWPDGIGLTWNGYGCCGPATDLKTDDVGFSRQLIYAMKARAAIDDDRVFVTGISNGGAMAHRMACEAADLVRAAAPVAYSLHTDQCRPSRPVHVTAFIGTADFQYEGVPGDDLGSKIFGLTDPVLALLPLPPKSKAPTARESFAMWKGINGCSDALARTQLPAGTRYDGSRWEEYQTCAGGVRTGLVTVVNGPHILYNGYVDPIFGGDPDRAPIDLAPWMWDNVFNM